MTEDKSYTSKCGCISKGYPIKKITRCTQHYDAFERMKPYSKYVHMDRGLCPLCHGYDEVIGSTVCVCDVYDRLQELTVIKRALESGMTIDEVNIEDIKLLDEIDRVRKRRGIQ